MSESGKKWFLWSSLVILVLSISGVIYLSLLPYSRKTEDLSTVAVLLLAMSTLNIVVLFSIRLQGKKWFRISALVSIFLLLPFSIGIYFLVTYLDNLPAFPVFITISLICLLFPLILFSLIYIFILRSPGEIKGVLVFLLLIIISIVLQQFDFSFSALEDMFIPGFILLTATGLYIFGVRCLIVVEKNIYLKLVSFSACLLTAFGGFLFLLKIEGNTTDILELIYFIPAFLMTIIVLLSLPFSGYIQWTSMQKKILKKVALSCIFFLLIFSLRFVYPDFFKQIVFSRPATEYPEFWLDDYEIPSSPGLESE